MRVHMLEQRPLGPNADDVIKNLAKNRVTYTVIPENQGDADFLEESISGMQRDPDVAKKVIDNLGRVVSGELSYPVNYFMAQAAVRMRRTVL